MAQYLARGLKDNGVGEGKVVVAKNISDMAALMRAGKVDLYFDSAFPSIIVSELTGSKYLLRRWKRGIGEYRSVIFVMKDGGLHKVADLRGKIIAFEEPYSSSGYFFPKLVLGQAGLNLTAKKEPSDAVAAGEVGYVFSNADENTMAWVLRGRVHAGATDHHSYVKQARGNIKDLAILHESAPIPRQIVSHRRGLADELVLKIKEILQAMDKSDEGKKALMEFEETTKFDSIPTRFSDLVSKTAPFLRQEVRLK